MNNTLKQFNDLWQKLQATGDPDGNIRRIMAELDSSPTKEVPQWIIDNLKPHNMPTSSIVLSDSEESIFSINNTTLDFHGKCSGIHLFPRSKFYQQLPNGEWEEVEP